jgi:hypothetical protein
MQGDDDASDPQCQIPNVFEGNILDHVCVTRALLFCGL